MPLKPHAEAAQAPQAKIDVLRPGAQTEILMRLRDRKVVRSFMVTDAEHDIGVATDIFCCRLDRRHPRHGRTV